MSLSCSPWMITPMTFSTASHPERQPCYNIHNVLQHQSMRSMRSFRQCLTTRLGARSTFKSISRYSLRVVLRQLWTAALVLLQLPGNSVQHAQLIPHKSDFRASYASCPPFQLPFLVAARVLRPTSSTLLTTCRRRRQSNKTFIVPPGNAFRAEVFSALFASTTVTRDLPQVGCYSHLASVRGIPLWNCLEKFKGSGLLGVEFRALKVKGQSSSS